jgi:hypothetical protein
LLQLWQEDQAQQQEAEDRISTTSQAFPILTFAFRPVQRNVDTIGYENNSFSPGVYHRYIHQSYSDDESSNDDGNPTTDTAAQSSSNSNINTPTTFQLLPGSTSTSDEHVYEVRTMRSGLDEID